MRAIQSDLKKHGIKMKPHKRKTRKSEKLSERDLRELMGTNRPTYTRHKGAYRQK
jgi:hypothetical protein